MEIPFNPSSLTKIQWTVSADFAAPSKGTIALDDIYFNAGSNDTPIVPQSYTIDNFEDMDNLNNFGSKWFYTDDSQDGGTSVITNATRDVNGYLFKPAAAEGFNASAGGKIDYKFGANKPVGCDGECAYGQRVSLATDLGSIYDFSNVRTLHFKAQKHLYQ